MSRRLGQVPALDGMRGLAILAVLGFHVVGSRFGGGWVGVHVFFVLSGFLITTLLLEEHQRTERISLVSFYIRRIVRLAPALLAMIAIFLVVIVVATHGRAEREQLHSAVLALTYRANLPGGTTFGSNQDLSFTWTLALEEQFYLVWPLALILALRRRVNPRTLLVTTLGLGLLLTAWRLGLSLDPHGPGLNHLYFRPDTTADSLLFGCAAAEAYVFDLVPNTIKIHWSPWLAFGVFAIMVLAMNPYHRWVYGVPLPLLTISVALTILALVTGVAPLATRLLSWPVLRFFGRISYSLYLWNSLVDEVVRRDVHVANVVHDVIILVVSVVIASASYYGLERPLVNLRRRLTAAPNLATRS